MLGRDIPLNMFESNSIKKWGGKKMRAKVDRVPFFYSFLDKQKRIEPFFAIKDSQVVRKKELFCGSLKLNLVELNLDTKR